MATLPSQASARTCKVFGIPRSHEDLCKVQLNEPFYLALVALILDMGRKHETNQARKGAVGKNDNCTYSSSFMTDNYKSTLCSVY